MSSLHLYTAPVQPATRFTDASSGEPHTFSLAPRRAIYTDCCHKFRWAQYVEVQSFFDGIRRWCAPGRGCKGKR